MSNKVDVEEPGMIFADGLFYLYVGEYEYELLAMEAFMLTVELNILVNDEPSMYKEKRDKGIEPSYPLTFIPGREFSREELKVLLNLIKTTLWNWKYFPELVEDVKVELKELGNLK